MPSCQPASKFSGREGLFLGSNRVTEQDTQYPPLAHVCAQVHTSTSTYYTQEKYPIQMKTIKLNFQTISEPHIRTLSSKRSTLFQNPEERRALTLSPGAGFDSGLPRLGHPGPSDIMLWI